MKQTILAIMFAQKYNRFVHYDLHSMNILLRKCDKDNVHVYKLDEDNIFYVPTYGYIPVIIDYGFGRSDGLLNNPNFISLAYNDAGYMAPAYDYMADMKLFLVTLSEDFREYRKKSSTTPVLRTIVKNMFAPLDIDWTSGWDIQREQPLVDQLFDYVENIDEKSRVFSEYSHFCMDILQSLITLPYTPKVDLNLHQLKKYYRIFVKNYYIIEKSIGNSFYSLYFLKKLIDIVREFKDEYLNENTKESALEKIKTHFYNEIHKTIKFCKTENVDYDMLVCSLLLFVEQFETQIYYMLNREMKRKYNNYRSLHVKSIEQIFGVIDINLETPYEFNDNTNVRMFDFQNQSEKSFQIDDVEYVNNLEHYLRGSVLAQYS
jgi:hypothetical protein